MRPASLSRRLPILGIALILALPVVAPAQEDFTTDFFIESCSFSNRGRDNPFFSLEPGDQLVLEGEDDGEEVTAILTVLQATELIEFTTPRGQKMRVRARVVEERESVDGELEEVSRNWFARCRQTNDIFYFGEEVDLYEDGEIVGTEGEWRAGEDGAQPGVIMPGSFFLGARYFQEQAPGAALDAGVNTGMDLDVEVPAGEFERCVEVSDFDLLDDPQLEEPELKVYCPGIGQVVDEGLELVAFSFGTPPGPPGIAWMVAPALGDFRVQARISVDGEARPVTQELCDAETVCVSGALPGRIEVLVRVPGPKPNGCFAPTITRLTTSEVEIWVERISTGEVRYYRLDGASPGSVDLPGLFDRAGFCPETAR